MGINDRGPVPTQIEAGERALTIHWSDGPIKHHDYVLMRRSCRCAACIEELTGRPLLDPDSVPADVSPTAITPVGTYAIQIEWSDGHRSGIFTYDHLRTMPTVS